MKEISDAPRLPTLRDGHQSCHVRWGRGYNPPGQVWLIAVLAVWLSAIDLHLALCLYIMPVLSLKLCPSVVYWKTRLPAGVMVMLCCYYVLLCSSYMLKFHPWASSVWTSTSWQSGDHELTMRAVVKPRSPCSFYDTINLRKRLPDPRY